MNLLTEIANPGAEKCNIARAFGGFLYDEFQKTKDFYFFSPDETTSNKLAQVYDATDRAWMREIKPWDKALSDDGRVVELLSENTLFAVLAGHILSGGHGVLASYESFLPIVSSQLDQHLKFLKQSKEVDWRPPYAALNIISTSCWQRQDHNGYTHQNPSLLTSALAKPCNLVNCLFPIDDISAAAAWEFMQKSENVVNITTYNKLDCPRWIDINHARFQYDNGGASIFGFASDDNPEVIVSAVGDIPTNESLEAIKLVKNELPELRVRFVGIAALSYGAIGTTENKLSQTTFYEYFTTDKPIVVNFHGYADTMKAILANYTDLRRVSVHGYEDQGSTTTPIDELSRNNCSRFELAADIATRAGRGDIADHFRQQAAQNAEYAVLYGLDR